MELIQKRNRRCTDKTLNVYNLGNYEVSVIDYDAGWKNIGIRPIEKRQYQPDIYARSDREGNVIGFDIQTTSYGALQVDQIRKVIEGLEEAAEAVKILTKEFVKEEQK